MNRRTTSPNDDEEFGVIDARKHNFWITYNIVADCYLRIIGCHAMAVYIVILRWSFGSSKIPAKWERKVSLTSLCEQTALSKNTVLKSLAVLEAAKLISTERSNGGHTNSYVIHDVPPYGSTELQNALSSLQSFLENMDRLKKTRGESETTFAPKVDLDSSRDEPFDLDSSSRELSPILPNGSRREPDSSSVEPLTVHEMNHNSSRDELLIVHDVNHTINTNKTQNTENTTTNTPRTNSSSGTGIKPSVVVVVPSDFEKGTPIQLSAEQVIKKLEEAGLSCGDARSMLTADTPIHSSFRPDLDGQVRRFEWLYACATYWPTKCTDPKQPGGLVSKALREGWQLPNEKKLAKKTPVQAGTTMTPKSQSAKSLAPHAAKVAAERKRLEDDPILWRDIIAQATRQIPKILREHPNSPTFAAALETKIAEVIATRLGVLIE